MRATKALSLALAIAGSSGCAASRVASACGGTTSVSPFLVSAVRFDHGCAQDQIVELRKAGPQADLDVCGTVRRYKLVHSGESFETWLDVTALYPPASLPAPRASAR
jgi:hypothetical protein